MWSSGSGYIRSSARSGAAAEWAGSRSIILGCRCTASRATALPKPQSDAPASAPGASRSSTCAPRVTNHTPFAGTRSESARPWTIASALAPARVVSSAISAVLASAPRPSSAKKCTTPLNGMSSGSSLNSASQDSRRSNPTPALKTPAPAAPGPFSSAPSPAASRTVWLRAASAFASSSATPPSSATSTQDPAGSDTSAGPLATITPRSGFSSGSAASRPSTSAASNPASPRACRHTSGLARA